MSLEDLRSQLKNDATREANNRLKPEYRPHVEMGATNGTAATGLVSTSLIGNDDDLLRLAGLDPAEWCLDAGSKKIWCHTDDDDKRSIYFGFHKRNKDDAVSAWLAAPFKGVEPVHDTPCEGLPLIVCLADMQTGKAGEAHGGTMELVERCENILGQLKALCERERPREIVVADLGDICEGTNNHTSTSQASTNDLPQSEQLRVAGRILMEYVTTLAPLCAHLTLAGVRSNHGEERLANGQANGVGDWGVALIKTIGDAIELLDGGFRERVTVLTEQPLAHGLALEVEGAHIAMLHGHYAKKVTKLGDWVAQQAGGIRDTIYRDAMTVIHGHFHHLTVQESRGRVIYGCPALECGSDWLTRSNGEYSNPGVLTLRVKDGRTCGLRIFEQE